MRPTHHLPIHPLVILALIAPGAASADTGRDPADEGIALDAVRVVGKRAPTPLKDRLAPGDRLLFSYSNVAAKPYTHLLVFAVDGAGKVTYFVPARGKPGTSVRAVPVAKGKSIKLPAVEQRLEPGPIAIFGIFCRRPMPGRELEEFIASLVKRGLWPVERVRRLGPKDTGQQVIHLRVER